MKLRNNENFCIPLQKAIDICIKSRSQAYETLIASEVASEGFLKGS